MDLGFANATAVVVGGGRGMGLAAARCMAEDGARVAVVSRSRDDLEAAVDDLTERGSPEALGLVADASDTGAVPACSTSTSTADRISPERRPMATAGNARSWAPGALRGIGDSLYTPFCGPDGDDIDWDAYRALVRYCADDLGHPMLWCTSGVAEFWSLTIDERKQLLELAIVKRARSTRTSSSRPAPRRRRRRTAWN